jgi:hypothetical protein
MPFYEAVFEEIGSGSGTCLLDDGGEFVQSGGWRHRLNTPPTTSPGWVPSPALGLVPLTR